MNNANGNSSVQEVINADRRELLLHKLARMRLSPRRYTLKQIGDKLGIDVDIVRRYLALDAFLEIKKQYLDKVRDAWEGEIQAVVIQRALNGSKYHTDLYYKLMGKLVDRVEVTKKTAPVPEKLDEINAEIERLTAETSAGIPPKSVPIESFATEGMISFGKETSNGTDDPTERL